MTGSINSTLSPVYGQNVIYSTLLNYKWDASGIIYKNKKSRNIFDQLLLSVGADGMKMPNVPVQFNNTRYLQSDWNNYTIWVSGLDPTQQKGQKTITYYEKMTAIFFNGLISFNTAYNDKKINGAVSGFSTSDAQSDTSYSIKYLSAGLKFNLRKNTLITSLGYDKSPEGQSQVNGELTYNISQESYFKSSKISSLKFNASIQSISPYQGLGLMMGTNVASSNGFSLATNNSFNTLPPKNINKEIHFLIGLDSEKYILDLRYYNRQTAGINNYTASYTDPATGLSSQTTYSTIINKGIEFYLKTLIVQNRNFSYTVTLNGAYNVNVAHNVPTTMFSASSSYALAYRNGYNTSNLWAYRWAGLNNQGDPQIYDSQGNITSVLDSNTLVNSMVYRGTLKAPWSGGWIHELTFKNFFARATVIFNWGYVMKYYMPTMTNATDRSVRTKDRWRNPGDEKYTDVPRITATSTNFRSYVIQNTDNNILSADNIRLQEIMIGWGAPSKLAHSMGMKSFQMSFQVQNAGLWTKNKLHIDPTTVGTDGKVSLAIPRQYSCTINITF